MKKLNLFLFVLIFAAGNFTLQAQNTNSLPDNPKVFLTEWQEILKQAIDSSVYLVRQDYALKGEKSGNKYGQGNKKYFGKGYAIGVMAGNIFYTDARLLKPWTGDSNYSSFVAVDTLDPVKTDFSVMCMSDKKTSGSNWAIDTSSAKKGWLTFSENKNSTSLPVTADSAAMGWLIIYYAKTSSDKTEDSITTSFIKTKLTKSTGNFWKPDKFTLKNNIIGGLYVTAKVTNGQVNIGVRGLLVNQDGQWSVSTFPVPAPLSNGGNNLTPIKDEDDGSTKGKDKKKDK